MEKYHDDYTYEKVLRIIRIEKHHGLYAWRSITMIARITDYITMIILCDCLCMCAFAPVYPCDDDTSTVRTCWHHIPTSDEGASGSFMCRLLGRAAVVVVVVSNN
ncbi:Uncharacterized protein BM_BM17831 [Brugia malayi]|uniref:Uncharacterized protein n=1 Tax=Brugia malayi TaxID=6279 RepID=A0A4E9G260_BRUMA|nr:Uncharacterized protein BM_BM17831 [Brugia malayi]VIO99456.1 Uncharacterized protein BM_BM17831 [Brugia malayi]